MGYQALLFCPDEKTARTVTQVLTELDFEVTACTEPFAAVKKLMAEHFDAVVVDCDNEQNATLLYKSARNAPNNHSALAVAVVEGQAGVAKAFRIGANLVLTKPINVEQAKGTLRVARGLLRKNEASKPAPTAASKPVSPTPAPVSASPISIVDASSSSPAQVSAIGISVQNRTPQESISTYASSAPAAAPKVEKAISAPAKQISPEMPATAPLAAVEVPVAVAGLSPESTPSKPQASAPSHAGFSSSTSSGAASAPAPALQPKSSISVSDPLAPVTPAEDSAPTVADKSAAQDLPASAPPVLTLEEASVSEPESSSGVKIWLVALAAMLLLAAGGYAAWALYGHSLNSSGSPSSVVKPATSSAATPPAVAPASSSPVSTSSALPSSPSSSSAIPSAATVAAQPSKPSVLTQDIHNLQKPAIAVSDDSTASSSSESAAPAVAIKPSTNAPIMVKSAGSKRGGAKPEPDADAPVPDVINITSAGNASLPNLMNTPSAPAPVLQTVNISQGVSQGLLIKKSPPSYPASAMRLRIEGPVALLATVSKTGNISAVKIISGDPNLARAAVEAVKQWKYKPYLLNGAPVEIQTQVTVNFKLPQ